ncbi:hypothetical protein ACFPJ4_14195 [Lysinimonas soli]|uniref:Uncharacterized protein n=1 Tax=Lysinimonas soli TaxID=1074233 RepID=A0ABW0NTI7_9MICO
MTVRATLAAALAIVVAAGLMTFASPQIESAKAADSSQFDPGNIISDALFYNNNAMGSAAIQSFLVSKEPGCTSSYACMWNYGQSTPAMAASSYCSAIAATGVMNAANIIFTVGQACGISQKVLLVLLQKEQGLVTATAPTSRNFTYATGFNCPDTSGCDPSYGGFFYQVYYAARQFKIYQAHPTSFNFQAGRVNNIQFNPNAACGSKSVFIQNAATAGLYDYTPYTPNDAAMSNLYGTGDGCSSYGNRNFWAYYTDWFGSTTLGTSLVRTSIDATVYLVSGTTKYPVTSPAILAALFPLGQTATVSQSYLDKFTTSHAVGRSLRGPDGSIYFFDAGILLPFTSCTQVTDYGASCDPSSYTQLTDAQIKSFYPGPLVTPVLGTTSGTRYWITGGTKREILDNQSQAAAGLPAAMNVLSDNAVADLPYAAPVVRDSVFIGQKGTATVDYFQTNALYQVSGDPAQLGATSRLAGSLSSSSLALLPAGTGSFSGAVTAPGDSRTQFLGAAGRYVWPAGVGGFSGTGAFAASQTLIDSYPVAGTIAVGTFVMASGNATVYVVTATSLKPISSWSSLLSLSSTPNPTILTVPAAAIAAAATGPVALTAGSLAYSPGNATVYLINGLTDKIPVSSFDMTSQAGVTALAQFPVSQLEAYPTNPSILGFGYVCGTTKYVAAAGSLHPIAAADLPRFPISFITLDSYTCTQMKIGTPAVIFIRTSDGSIYLLDSDGTKRPVSSLQRFLYPLNGVNIGYLQVSQKLADLIPTGIPA